MVIKKKEKEKLTLIDKVLFGCIAFFLGTVVISIICHVVPIGKIEAMYYMHQWNSNIDKGRYGCRFDNENLVIEIVEGCLKVYKSGGPCINLDGWDINWDYKKVKWVNTVEKKVHTEWVKADMVRQVNSNWGLTQEVEQIKKQVREITTRVEAQQNFTHR